MYTEDKEKTTINFPFPLTCQLDSVLIMPHAFLTVCCAHSPCMPVSFYFSLTITPSLQGTAFCISISSEEEGGSVE